ncbi:MAG TPA: hypothetical protein VFB14_00890 [Bryobacteraceae bacterium]|jgi:hypothetical protein|nr:hypothetical protein [Bryobacteraceae bacterium]
MKRIAVRTLIAIIVPVAAGSIHAQQTLGSEEAPYWAIQAGGGFIAGISQLANAEQNRFQVSGSGPVFDAGIARMHKDGSPSFSVAFTRLAFDGNAKGVADEFAGNRYSGSTSLPGVLATKYFNFVHRRRFSMGVGLGAGIGPQLSVKYRTTYAGGGTAVRTWSPKELSVTPLFAATYRADVRLNRHLSIGPFAGIEDALPVFGATIRVALPR